MLDWLTEASFVGGYDISIIFIINILNIKKILNSQVDIVIVNHHYINSESVASDNLKLTIGLHHSYVNKSSRGQEILDR